MSDLRRHASCLDCEWSCSGSGWADWIADHIDANDEHRVVVTQHGDLSVGGGTREVSDE